MRGLSTVGTHFESRILHFLGAVICGVAFKGIAGMAGLYTNDPIFADKLHWVM